MEILHALVPILGKEAFGVVDLGNFSSGAQNYKIYVRKWDQLGQKIPIYDSIGYQARFGSVMLNSCFGVAMMCGVTDLV